MEISSRIGGITEALFNRLDAAYVSATFGRASFSDDNDISQFRDFLRQHFIEHGKSRSIHQLFETFGRTPRIFHSDFLGAISFNISPEMVRMPEDIAGEPEIAPDGRELAATLFALKNSPPSTQSFQYYFSQRYFENPHKMIEKIVSYSKIVNESICDIRVYPDAIEVKIGIFLIVHMEMTSCLYRSLSFLTEPLSGLR